MHAVDPALLGNRPGLLALQVWALRGLRCGIQGTRNVALLAQGPNACMHCVCERMHLALEPLAWG